MRPGFSILMLLVAVVTSQNVPQTLPSRVECLEMADGQTYRGNKNTTVTGWGCQEWPDTDGVPDGSHNFCRNSNPDDKSTLWCYSANPGMTWEYCDVPICGKSYLNNVCHTCYQWLRRADCIAPPLLICVRKRYSMRVTGMRYVNEVFLHRLFPSVFARKMWLLIAI